MPGLCARVIRTRRNNLRCMTNVYVPMGSVNSLLAPGGARPAEEDVAFYQENGFWISPLILPAMFWIPRNVG